MSSRRGAEAGRFGGSRRTSVLSVVLGPTLWLSVGGHARGVKKEDKALCSEGCFEFL